MKKQIVINDLLNYNNLKIVQNKDMFNFSLDSVLLPNFVTINKNISKILDIGTGNAPIPLILSTKTQAKIIGVEIQKDVYELAMETISINKLNHQIELINADIKDLYKNWETDTFDIIVCNPPFFKLNDGSNLNNSNYKTISRHEITLNLNDIMKISKKLLKNNGKIAIVHRPDRLIEIIEIMEKNNIEPKKIMFVYPKEGKEANTVLIEGSKNGKKGLTVLPPLIVHHKNNRYHKDVLKYFKESR